MTGTIAIELDVFSGRPNPGWTLEAAAGQHLLAMLAALPPAHPVGSRLTGLGFRGFVVRLPDGHGSLRIIDDRVEQDGFQRDDPAKGVARLLRDSAPPEVRATFGPMMRD